ncbi:MAG: response regulator [Alkalispirochaeta sp.]|jgi:two-component system chemotaxis response regulator CheY
MLKGLIVDDAAIMRMRLREILEPQYTIVAEAEDGDQALQRYREVHPDFVTLDISMPRMDGMTALARLVTEFDNPRIVIVSAVGQQKLVLEAIKLGACDFVVKPFDPERVLKALERVARRVTGCSD